jgi:hypothetical protein
VPANAAKRDMAFEQTVTALKLSRRWLVHALQSLPEEATGMSKATVNDARDAVDVAIEVLEESQR